MQKRVAKFLVMIVFLSFFLLASCAAELELPTESAMSREETGVNTETSSDYLYTGEASIEVDGLVVYEDYNIIGGQAEWDEFLAETEKGNACEVRLVFYVTLEGQGITPAHEQYNEIKDDYPKFFIQDLSFDGAKYTLYWVEEEKEYVREYEYLEKFEDELGIRYLLVHDNNLTWQQISRSMYSSQSSDHIDWQTVYAQKQ